MPTTALSSSPIAPAMDAPTALAQAPTTAPAPVPGRFESALRPGVDRAVLGTSLASPRCPQVYARHSRWRTMREWRALGMIPKSGSWPEDAMMASLIEPDGPGHTAYLLTGNYRVILDYNCSNLYALSVGLLADEIAR
jgi:hypothetical protein